MWDSVVDLGSGMPTQLALWRKLVQKGGQSVPRQLQCFLQQARTLDRHHSAIVLHGVLSGSLAQDSVTLAAEARLETLLSCAQYRAPHYHGLAKPLG